MSCFEITNDFFETTNHNFFNETTNDFFYESQISFYKTTNDYFTKHKFLLWILNDLQNHE